MSTFCEQRIKKRRQKLNMTQDDLAEKIGYTSNRNISNYEKGTRSPDFETLCKIADALSCTTDYLLGREENDTHEAASITEKTGLNSATVEKLIENNQLAQRLSGVDAAAAGQTIEFIDGFFNYPEYFMIGHAFAEWVKCCMDAAPFAQIQADINAAIMGQSDRAASRALLLRNDKIIGRRYAFMQEIEAFLTDTQSRIIAQTEQAHFKEEKDHGKGEE